MKKIHEAVRKILYSEQEALYALTQGYMNLSAYAKRIQDDVERLTLKDVRVSGIVVALSRLQKELGGIDPLQQDVVINNIITKSPLVEIVYAKTQNVIRKLSSLYEEVHTNSDDFLNVTLSTSDAAVICSERLRTAITDHFEESPRLVTANLASLGISFDPKYYELPNVGYSLMHRVAQRKIVLAEIVSTHTEMIFVFDQKYLSEMMDAFS